MEDQRTKRTGASTRPHPRRSRAGYRSQALIVRRPGDGPETAHPAPAVPAETMSQVPRRAGPPPPRTEETTP